MSRRKSNKIKKEKALYTNGLTAEEAKNMWKIPVEISNTRRITMTPKRAKEIYGIHLDEDIECLEFNLEYKDSTEGFMIRWAVNWETGQQILARMNASKPSKLNGQIIDALAPSGVEIKGLVCS